MSDYKSQAASLYAKAKQVAGDDNKACLNLLLEAYTLHKKPKYLEKIQQLQVIIAESEPSDSSESSEEDIILISARKPQKQRPVIIDDEADDIRPSASTATRVDSLTNAIGDVSVAEATCSSSTAQTEMNANGDSYKRTGNEKLAGKRPNHVDVGGHRVKYSIYKRLYEYQTDGLKFLFNLFDEKAHGCILADDMGLGKTIQTIVLLSTLMAEERIRSVLIVAPTTLLVNWGKEFKSWYPDVDIYSYHQGSQKNRLEQLRTVQRRGGVIFTTFGLLQNHVQYMNTYRDNEFVWDFVVLDEAHKIKNPTKTTRAVSELPSRFNLAITGTPVQNNLKELWTIYNWVMKGELLGGYTGFKEYYEIPITNARKKDASDRVKKRGTLLAEDLRKVYSPFFLRRTKDEVMGRRTSLVGESGLRPLPPKYDWIVWITLTAEQIEIYQQYLSSKGVRDAKHHKKNVLTKLVDLKKICDSPFLLSRNMVAEIDKIKRNNDLDTSQLDALLDEEDNDLVSIEKLSVETLMSNTAKLIFLVDLLENLRFNKHRTLVFSQSTRMLDIIQKVLQERNFQMARLDGRVKHRDRDRIVTTFQESDTIDVCLLSTGVGSVGLTLTNADRVIIYDPSWNPGSDAQAIDRAYRIGQTKPVLVYRLITCATVEEKIFIRQVFKNSVIKQMVQSEQDPTRYFATDDIRELLRFEDPYDCKTFNQIKEMHSHQLLPCSMTDDHQAEVRSCRHCFNVSDHSLLFSVTAEEIILNDDDEANIRTNVVQTRQNLDAETDGIRKNYEGKFTRPFEMRVNSTKYSDRRLDLSPMQNPTEISEDIEVEEVNESEVFDGPTLQIEDSDLQIISPIQHESDGSPNYADAVDSTNRSSDSELNGGEGFETDSDSLASSPKQPVAMCSSHNSSEPQKHRKSRSPASSSLSPANSQTSNSSSCDGSGGDADDSEVVAKAPKRRLRMIETDSERSSRISSRLTVPGCGPCDTSRGTSVASAESPAPCAATNGGNVRSVLSSERLEPKSDGFVDADDPYDSDASRASSPCLDYTPGDFKTVQSKFHSTAVNFDPMESPFGGAKSSRISAYFSPQTAPYPALSDTADDTIIIRHEYVSESSDAGSSPVLGGDETPRTKNISSDGLEERLSQLSIPKFDRTNRILMTLPLRNQDADQESDRSHESSSPVLDQSYGDFNPIRHSLVKTPTPTKLNFSLSRNSDSSISGSERPDSPVLGEESFFSNICASSCLKSPVRDQATPRKTDSAGTSPALAIGASMSHVTHRKSRMKSRLGRSAPLAAGAALNFSGAEDEDDLC